MNAFRTRQIRKKSPITRNILKILKNILIQHLKPFFSTTKKQKSYFLGFILIIFAIFIVFKVTVGIFNIIGNFDPGSIALSLGTELKKDKYGYTNIVLLGDGGHKRAGADLIDTIMVASIDFKTKSVSIISMPRDYFVKNKKYGMVKINSFYIYNKKELGEEKAYEIYQEILGEIFNMDIQYYLRIDFNAFVEVIDSLGGITVDVKKDIYDPFYPKNTDDGYTVFEIKKGINNLDGETALKFVRSRKTTSDFDRASRQQQVLMAIREKALSGDVLTSPGTIKKIYKSINDNINTNLSTREMLSMAAFAKKFDRNSMVTKVLHDDPSRDGGLLYTPEREAYNGQFVLLPNSIKEIQRYAQLIFQRRDIFINPAKIEILNASSKSGVARTATVYLSTFGFDIVSVDNYLDESGKRKKVDKGFIRYNKELNAEGKVVKNYDSTLSALTDFIIGDLTIGNKSDSSKADISIVIGEDYQLY